MKSQGYSLWVMIAATVLAMGTSCVDKQNAQSEGDLFMVIDLSGGPKALSYPVSYLNAPPADGWTDEYKTTLLVMRRIPAGTFTMGSPENELGRRRAARHMPSNENRRVVSLTNDYYIGVFQVTQKQWERVMGTWPSYFGNPDYRDSRPLESRSWNDIRGGAWPGEPAGSGQPAADTFVDRLRARTGLSTLDLPTETQWEYACRAGKTTAFNSGKHLTDMEECPNMSDLGRYRQNHPGGYASNSDVSTDGGTAKAGSYLPNAWGLYDMHGNVWEWCLDWFTETSHPPYYDYEPLIAAGNRALRGGGWNSSARSCRSAIRSYSKPPGRFINGGFRLARTLPYRSQ